MPTQPRHGFFLKCCRNDVVLPLRGPVIAVFAIDIALHMSRVALELPQHCPINHVQIIGLPIGLCRPFFNVLHHPFEILNAIFVGHHVVIAQIFGLRTRVKSTPFITFIAQTVVGCECLCHLTAQGLLLGELIFKLRTILITPLNGPHIIIIDARKKSLFADMIFGLRYIIEARIVHDAGRMTVFLHPSLVA